MTSAKPTLALCVPAYKAEEHLPLLLETAKAQIPSFDEIIVCVDASPDETAEVARELGVKVLVNEQNLGCSRSKNRALEAATTDWVHFHDADDILLPGFTAEAHRWMGMKEPPEVVVTGFEYKDFASKELLAVGLVDDDALANDPVRYNISNKIPNFGIYQRKALLRIGGFDCDPETLYNEDVAFHCKLALAGFKFRASQKITSINWRYGDSMSGANQLKCYKAHFAIMRNMAVAVGHKYPEEIATRLWAAATGMAMYSEWKLVDAALAQAKALYKAVPPGQSEDFARLCQWIGPRLAFRFREQMIRWVKPQYRKS